MENGLGKITKEDVMSKLKDDGDFDRLRLKIIRKVKDDEELRNSIISTVRQSEALNRPNAKKMKPRQLSDAIYQEVGTRVMSEISDGVWKIIRSGDGMKNEITETVQSVYNKILNPNVIEGGQISSGENLQSFQKGLESNGNATSSTCEINGVISTSAPNEPPGFAGPTLCKNSNNNHEEHKLETHNSAHCLDPNDDDTSAPPGFSKAMEHEQQGDGSDEDPDVPPGVNCLEWTNQNVKRTHALLVAPIEVR